MKASFWRHILIAAVTLPVAACASSSGFPDNPDDTGADLQALKLYFDPAEIVAYNAASGPAKDAIEKDIIYGRLAAYDIEYARFEQDINKERAIGDLSSDLISLGLTATGASIASKTAKTALLAATTAVTGAKTSFDTNLFYNKALQAMFAQMDANRATIRANIEKGLAQGSAQYPLGAALMDTFAYREGGSMPGGLNAVTASAGTQKTAAQAQMSAMRLK